MSVKGAFGDIKTQKKIGPRSIRRVLHSIDVNAITNALDPTANEFFPGKPSHLKEKKTRNAPPGFHMVCPFTNLGDILS